MRMLAALGVVVVTVASGCTSDVESGPKLITQAADRSPNGEEAGVRAVVRYDTDRDCVYFGSGVRRLPVWPHGYATDRKDGKVRVLNEEGQVVAVQGDRIETNGGFHPLPDNAESCGVAPSTDAAAVLGEVHARR